MNEARSIYRFVLGCVN